jgi:hypothetical protein
VTPLELLKDARARIADPTRWTKGANARNAEGREVVGGDDRATCWCAVGAVLQQPEPIADSALREALFALSAHVPPRPRLHPRRDLPPEQIIAEYNDERASHADVLALYDRTIADMERFG